MFKYEKIENYKSISKETNEILELKDIITKIKYSINRLFVSSVAQSCP